MLAVIMNLHDVRMMERGDNVRLGTETGEQFAIAGVDGPHHFKGHEAVQRRLTRLVNHAHAATADLFENLIACIRFGDSARQLD